MSDRVREGLLARRAALQQISLEYEAKIRRCLEFSARTKPSEPSALWLVTSASDGKVLATYHDGSLTCYLLDGEALRLMRQDIQKMRFVGHTLAYTEASQEGTTTIVQRDPKEGLELHRSTVLGTVLTIQAYKDSPRILWRDAAGSFWMLDLSTREEVDIGPCSHAVLDETTGDLLAVRSDELCWNRLDDWYTIKRASSVVVEGRQLLRSVRLDNGRLFLLWLSADRRSLGLELCDFGMDRVESIRSLDLGSSMMDHGFIGDQMVVIVEDQLLLLIDLHELSVIKTTSFKTDGRTLIVPSHALSFFCIASEELEFYKL